MNLIFSPKDNNVLNTLKEYGYRWLGGIQITEVYIPPIERELRIFFILYTVPREAYYYNIIKDVSVFDMYKGRYKVILDRKLCSEELIRELTLLELLK